MFNKSKCFKTFFRSRLLQRNTGYIQIDGEDVLKPNTIKDGRVYAPGESIAAAVAKATTQQPLTFVLIHGSWADVSFWDKTAAELRKAGIPSTLLNMPVMALCMTPM